MALEKEEPEGKSWWGKHSKRYSYRNWPPWCSLKSEVGQRVEPQCTERTCYIWPATSEAARGSSGSWVESGVEREGGGREEEKWSAWEFTYAHNCTWNYHTFLRPHSQDHWGTPRFQTSILIEEWDLCQCFPARAANAFKFCLFSLCRLASILLLGKSDYWEDAQPMVCGAFRLERALFEVIKTVLPCFFQVVS